jgi:menaquinol-cytochrome c reductase iron-sulfur subunit
MDKEPSPPSPQEQEEQRQREGVSRRTFLIKVAIALDAIVTISIAVPLGWYLFGAVRPRRNAYLRWISIGDVNDFKLGETTLITFENPITTPWDGYTAKVPAYVRREGASKFTVFAINCAHLGCPVRWFPESQLFMCPCHGGVYYADGSRASGPPPRGLFTYRTRVEGGKLLIEAGQIPTLATQANLNQEISPCPQTKNAGTSASIIG